MCHQHPPQRILPHVVIEKNPLLYSKEKKGKLPRRRSEAAHPRAGDSCLNTAGHTESDVALIVLLRTARPKIDPGRKETAFIKFQIPKTRGSPLPFTATYLKTIKQGICLTPLSEATYNKYICQNEEKQQNFTVGTVGMFLEPSVKH